ncbi:MAG: ribulose-phosphate 3-epimerase [Saprospiraceae bacterium]|jgi:ribulose-phosphate 3-epimerase|nr:ribulose-phosphate 3-epimerase [Saprospiraceae bacterium]HQU95478.1 ribulose-phosphate 3-epimerase [Saprospiraceae bacterium]HQW96132.1 ribulose-phosphate 3-epimerase [Saprospiraceae bacterium]
MNGIIAPSILSADFTKLSEEIEMINQSEADWFHVDVMDGVFVPNLTMGFLVVKAIHKLAKKPLDVHLMTVHPERYIEQWRDAGAEHISVHYEACTHLHRVIQQIKHSGAKAGVAINPHTPIALLSDIIADLDLVIVMSVNPGFGGQTFIPRTFEKVKELASMIKSQNASTLIEIDGGVTLANARLLIDAGAQALVAGNTVFNSPNPTDTIHQLKKEVSHNKITL